jgi:hypothetical protein
MRRSRVHNQDSRFIRFDKQGGYKRVFKLMLYSEAPSWMLKGMTCEFTLIHEDDLPAYRRVTLNVYDAVGVLRDERTQLYLAPCHIKEIRSPRRRRLLKKTRHDYWAKAKEHDDFIKTAYEAGEPLEVESFRAECRVNLKEHKKKAQAGTLGFIEGPKHIFDRIKEENDATS